TAAWAQRYDPDFDRAMEFLAASEKARDAEVTEKENARRRELERVRRVAIAMASLFLLSVGSGVYAFKKRVDAGRYADQAVNAYKIAHTREQEARAAEREAIAQRENAERRKSEADAATRTAVEQRRLAQSEEARAEAAQVRAQKEADEADHQRNVA